MHERLFAVVGLLCLCACSSTDKYLVMPDGSRAVLYPADTVIRWPVVDGAHQSASGVRIYIDDTVRFDQKVRLGEGVRIGANSLIEEDVSLLPNATIGENTRIGGDVVV